MKSLWVILATTLATFVACASAGPEQTVKSYFDCQNKKDPDCTMSYLSDKLIAKNRGAIGMKIGLKRGFDDTDYVEYAIDRQASGGNSAEAEVSITVHDKDSAHTTIKMRQRMSLVKAPDGKWLIDDITPLP